jgi:uncharacterized membrane protein
MRRAYIDVARGLAVLLMIEAHTLDAWTRVADKSGTAFRNATILGGFAAPLFLWLAGVGVALAARRTASKTGSRRAAADALGRRGLEIFVLAFLFRLQAFIVSPGGHPVTLFRVDILNVMGPAIVMAGLLWASTRSDVARVWTFAMAAALVAMVTPIVRAAAWVDGLPTWFQWYVRPAGEHTTFTLLPWMGFVFAGGATGVLVAATRDDRAESKLQVWLAIAGASLVAVGFLTAARPSIYASSSFWTSSPTWFAIRLGVMMMALAALKGCATVIATPFATVVAMPVTQAFRPAWDSVARMGRASLFIYWIHVELVYGYASWLWRGRLPLWGTAVAFFAFSVLMYGALVLRDRVTGGLDESPRIRPSTGRRWHWSWRRSVRHAGADVG